MRIVDDTGRLWRAPEVKFSSTEIDLEAFGHNIANRDLVAALEQRAAALPNLTVIDDETTEVAPDADGVTVTRKNGATLRARLVVGADGRRSMCREAAGIGVNEHAYKQVALTVILRHSRPHRDTSTEFHTPSGPFTLVPLPGLRSSLVWVLEPHRAEEIAALDDATLAAEIERAAGDDPAVLGRIKLIARRTADQRQFAGLGKLAARLPQRQRVPGKGEHRVAHGDVDERALPALVTCPQRQKNIDHRRKTAAANIGGQQRRQHGRIDWPRLQIEQPGRADIIDVIARTSS